MNLDLSLNQAKNKTVSNGSLIKADYENRHARGYSTILDQVGQVNELIRTKVIEEFGFKRNESSYLILGENNVKLNRGLQKHFMIGKSDHVAATGKRIWFGPSDPNLFGITFRSSMFDGKFG